MTSNKQFIELLTRELVVALGCTEPVAVAYAAALARKYAGGADLVAVNAFVSGNIVKNAMAVTIPGTSHCGVDMAVALGVVAGMADRKLEVLSKVTESDVGKAEDLLGRGLVNVAVAESGRKLYIEVNVQTAKSSAKVVIADEHTRVDRVEIDGAIMHLVDNGNTGPADDAPEPDFLNLESIWNFIESVDTDELCVVKRSIDLNAAIAEEGLRNPYGLQVGRTMKTYMEQKVLGDDLVNYAVMLAAAGTDARMSGCPLPVVSNSGSGNQGLSATLPVLAAGKRLNSSDKAILRAVTLSHLITIYIKGKFGRLSALCGGIVSGTGASCGIVYLLGGGFEAAKIAVQNMLGNVTGMLCDGAKPGCALKIATCTTAAGHCALLAVKGFGIRPTEGIIDNSPLNSIDNLCRIGNQGTAETDRIILDIMLSKQERKRFPDRTA